MIPLGLRKIFHVMARAALELFKKGHLPVLGIAGACRSLRRRDPSASAMRCSIKFFTLFLGCLCRGLMPFFEWGPSQGADEMLSIARRSGKQIFREGVRNSRHRAHGDQGGKMNERIRVKEEKVLSDDWYLLKKTTFDFRRSNGSWQTLSRKLTIGETGR